jgi:hypothetical protein
LTSLAAVILDFPVATACRKVRKYSARSTSIFLILPERDNSAMHNDYVFNHIFGERSQTQCCGIARLDSDAAMGRKLTVSIDHNIANLVNPLQVYALIISHFL